MAIETLGAALRQINRLFADGAVTGHSDAQLLDRFLAQRDAGAFEALVARHGPMVLSVCRGVLRDSRDVEDAFQATFLVLVKKGGTIRGRDALGGWLHRVAHRVAIQANAAAARRRTHERQAGEMAVATSTSRAVTPDELLPALHEEIARLPETYRLAIVLCDLEGMTQTQAARQLHWSERTLRNRLVEGRARLRRRLARLGLAPDGAMLGAVFLGEARAAVPPAWSKATADAAMDLVNHTITAGAVSAAAGSLAREVLRIMLLQKLKLASAALLSVGLIAWAASAALSLRGDEPPKVTPAAVAPRAVQAPVSQPAPAPDSFDAVGTFPVHGRVLDPDGKPVANAAIYVRHEIDWERPPNEFARVRQPGRVTTSGADGRFRFELDKAASDDRSGNDLAWHNAQVAAVARGFGPAWINVEALLSGDEATLPLVRDDVPIRGRVLDSQGRPAAGVTVRVEKIGAARDGADLDKMLASGEVDNDVVGSRWFFNPTWLGRHGTWTTDADGRFEIVGIGRDRIVGLEFGSPTLEHATLCAMGRAAQAPMKPRPRPSRGSQAILRFPAFRLVAATFEHILGPCKPIAGVVRLKGTGKPLAGVRILGYELTTSARGETTTDAEGRFRLLGLPKAQSYVVRAAPLSGVDHFLGATITLTDTAGLEPIATTFELPRGVVVTGRLIDMATDRAVRVFDMQYNPLPGNRNGGETASGRSGTTDPAFRITVPPGEGVIRASARGWETPYARAQLRPADQEKLGGEEAFARYYSSGHAYRIVNVPADVESFTADLELTRGLTRKGKLVGPDGQPVIGARCYGVIPSWGYLKTLADDSFEVFGLESGRPRLVIFAHQARRLVGSVVINKDNLKADAPMVVRLEPAGSIKGRLVDEDGLPLGGARIAVLTWDLDGRNLPPGANHGGSYCLWPDGEIFVSVADGRFQVDGLKPGVRSTLNIENSVRPVSYLSINDLLRNAGIKPGEVRDVGDVKITARPEPSQ